MPEKFNPKQFESFESLPEEEKESFKKVDDGFVRKEALSEYEAVEQAEKMREKIDKGEAKDYGEAEKKVDSEKQEDKKEEFTEEEQKELDKILADIGNFNFSKLDGIPAKFHQLIALKLIETRREWCVAENLSQFIGLDQEVALKLIEVGEERTVLNNLSQFQELNLKEIALKLIKSGKGWRVAKNLSIFEGWIDKEVALKLITTKEQFALDIIRNLSKFGKLDHKEIALKMIEAGDGEAVANNLYIFEGLEHKEIALKMIEAGNGRDVMNNMFRFKRLDREIGLKLIEDRCYVIGDTLEEFEGLEHKEIALKMIEAGDGRDVIEHLSKFKGLNYNEIWTKLIEAGQDNNADHNIDKFQIEPKFIEQSQKLNFSPSETYWVRDVVNDEKFDTLPKNEQSKLLYDKLKEKSSYWKDEENVSGPFEEGGEYFGYDKMFKYIGQENRHDTMYNFRKIVNLAKQSGLKPEQFFGNILQQVSMDDGQYGEEENTLKSYQYLNNIADAVDIEKVDEILEKVREYKDIDKLQELVQGFSNKENIFENWKSLRKYYELTQLLGKAEILDELKELKAQGKEKLYRYIETLAFHPNIDMQKVMQFWREPEKFLNIGEIHASESHERKKPSNYIEIPHLDLTAEDLRDALVEGDLDKLQDWEALEIKYGIGDDRNGEGIPPFPPLEKGGTIEIKDEVFKALGSRKKGIKGEAKDPNKLFNELNNIFKKHNLKLMDYLQGDVELLAEVEIMVNEKLYDEEIGLKISPTPALLKRGISTEYRAKINFKSDPDGVVAGNDTACCMPFGSGKNNVYTYNPVCALFTAQKKSGDNWRTIAQSILTKDIDIKKSVPEIINQMEQGMVKLDSLVDEDVLIESDKKITADNIEVAPNFKSNLQKDETLKYIYTDFFREYIKKFGEKEKLDKKEMIIGKGYTDAMEDLEDTDNTFIPIAPVGYSDNVGEKALKLDLSKEASGLDADKSADLKTKPSRKDLVELKEKGLEHLTYKDSLQVAYLEGKAYADNASFMEYLHNMENALIAKDINNVRKDRVNLSLKYIDGKGKMQGYILAYEGKFEEEPVIYVADLAAHPEAKMAGGRLLKGFLELYGDNYIEKDKLTPILADAREKTSYQIILKQAEKMGKELGVIDH